MRSIPQSVHDRAKLLATVHPLRTVAELVGVLPSQLSRMKSRGWVAPPDGRPKRPMPNDFAIQSRSLTFSELADHYGAGNATVRRWIGQLQNPRPSWKGRNLRRRLNG